MQRANFGDPPESRFDGSAALGSLGDQHEGLDQGGFHFIGHLDGVSRHHVIAFQALNATLDGGAGEMELARQFSRGGAGILAQQVEQHPVDGVEGDFRHSVIPTIKDAETYPTFRYSSSVNLHTRCRNCK
jgi:hypothetical protein